MQPARYESHLARAFIVVVTEVESPAPVDTPDRGALPPNPGRNASPGTNSNQSAVGVLRFQMEHLETIATLLSPISTGLADLVSNPQA